MRWVLMAVVITLFAAGCGTEPVSESTATSTTGVPYTTRTWYNARYADGSTSVVVLTFLKPVGDGCEERHIARVGRAGNDLRAEVRVNEPWAPPTCDVAAAEIELDLGAPLGDRRLLTSGGNMAFVDRGGTLEIDPLSTPCGRADCSQPSPDPAPCTDEAASASIASEIDGADPGGTILGCDGSFLAVDLTVGAGSCPPDMREECARPQRAYFVAREGSWRLVTYGRDMTCEEVFRAAAIRFPASVCGAG